MKRRELLAMAALTCTSASSAQRSTQTEFFEPMLSLLIDGYLRNARRTASSLAVCDFQDGTKRKDGLARSGNSYCGVSRMLPALAASVLSGRDADGQHYQAIRAVYRHAFDPAHEDYWGPAPADKPDLRQVEASLIAWVLWLLRDRLVEDLSSAERVNVQSWLASCTVHAVRGNNFAWFTAVNQAVRISLADRWPEFSGDASSMLADLRAMDQMYVGDGWYSDGKDTRISDYYSFWVFTSHYLYWREMVGDRYPEWDARFSPRVRELLEHAPHLFAANGAHAMMGVSLIYRWAILTAFVLAYRQHLWPHPPGLLRAIVRRNLQFFWSNGAFDIERGKLRERLSDVGTPEFAESYIDNGHPYWGMQAFVFLTIPRNDPFWSAPEQQFPCEKRDLLTALKGPGLLIANSKASGDSRLYFAGNGRYHPIHRDRYTKFSYSGRFPFCFTKQRDRATWDNALVFRNPNSGVIAGRAGVHAGRLIAGGVETDWWAEIEGARIRVVTQLFPDGDMEARRHVIYAPVSAVTAGVEVLEGSAALPLGRTEKPKTLKGGPGLSIVGRSGKVGVVSHDGYESVAVETDWPSLFGREIHILAPRCAVVTLRTTVREGQMNLMAKFLSRPSRHFKDQA